MASYNKFEGWVGYLGTAATNLHTATYRAYLTNNAPSASADDVVGDLLTCTEQNGYSIASNDITNTYAEANGTGTVTVVDVVITATGAVGPFQYVVVFDDTHASDILCCWWDYGSSISLADGETFTIDFTDNTLLTIA